MVSIRPLHLHFNRAIFLVLLYMINLLSVILADVGRPHQQAPSKLQQRLGQQFLGGGNTLGSTDRQTRLVALSTLLHAYSRPAPLCALDYTFGTSRSHPSSRTHTCRLLSHR